MHASKPILNALAAFAACCAIVAGCSPTPSRTAAEQREIRGRFAPASDASKDEAVVPAAIDSPRIRSRPYPSRRVANTIAAASCARADVQTAVNAAANGDTVSVPSGACTWTAPVTWIDKDVRVIGAGIGATVIALTANSAFEIKNNAGKPFRISGMTIGGAPTGNPNVILIDSSNTETPVKGWRIDHVRFNFTNASSLRAIMVDGINYGLVDHCAFDGQSYLGVHVRAYTNPEFDRGEMTGTKSWSYPLNLGSDEAVYVEDSAWNLAPSGLPFVNDLSFGGRMVFRHNTIRSSIFQAHSARSNDRGGGAKYEIYNNTWIGNGFFRMGQIRSGTGVIFNNTISGYSTNNIHIDDQRAATETGCAVSGPPAGVCNGANPLDGNAEANGWPCLDQIGRGTGAPKQQVSVPLYAWNNGTTTTCATGGVCDNATRLEINPACASSANWIKTSNAPHAGGIVDYLNNGSTPKPGYTPYVYPHPSQQMQ